LSAISEFVAKHPQLTAMILGLVAVLSTLKGGMGLFADVKGILATIFPSLGTAATAFTTTAVAEDGAAASADAVGVSMGAALLPILAVVAGVALLAVGVYEVIKNWSTIQPFLMKLWNDVKDLFVKGIQDIGNFLKENWPLILAIITGPIGLMVGEIAKHWTEIIAGVADFKDKIAAGMGDIKTEIVKIWTDIENFFKSLPSKFLQWGEDMINGLISGIKNTIGKVEDAVKGVADKIKSYLHFSAPDVGPLADIGTWMPDMMGTLAAGIQAHKGALQSALTDAASGIKVGMNASLQGGAATTAAAASAPVINFNGPLHVHDKDDATLMARQLGQMIQSAQFAQRGR
jgi:phage-related minor tail protein